jgi:phage shock protein A
MTILTRISRLLRADVHHLLDQLEEPDVLLRQAIREMQDNLDHSHRTRNSLDNECRQQDKRLAVVAQDQATITGQIQLCLQTGNKGLARNLMRRRLEQQKIAALLTARREELSQALAEIDLSLQQRVQLFEDLQQKAALLGVLTDQFDPRRQGQTSFAVTEDEIDIALLAEQQLGRCV